MLRAHILRNMYEWDGRRGCVRARVGERAHLPSVFSSVRMLPGVPVRRECLALQNAASACLVLKAICVCPCHRQGQLEDALGHNQTTVLAHLTAKTKDNTLDLMQARKDTAAAAREREQALKDTLLRTQAMGLSDWHARKAAMEEEAKAEEAKAQVCVRAGGGRGGGATF